MNIKYLFLILHISAVNLFFAQHNVKHMGHLPDHLMESSGLIFYGDKVISHNDSGNSPELFELDPFTMKIVRTVRIINAVNIDWEDITQDDEFIYVGDIGNNQGVRKELLVYKVAKSDFRDSTTITAEKIFFSYPDQPIAVSSKSDFDAEALFSLGNNLVVLTKQWNSQGTSAYQIPKTSGNHVAKKLGSYHSNGMITGATFNDKTKTGLLVGYNLLMLPFVIEIKGFTNENLFSGTVKRTNLEIGFVQAEGITNRDDKNYYITSESFATMGTKASLFSFTLDD